MASIRQLARCIGLSGDISIIRDFYGYTKVPTGNQLSLLTQARLLKSPHIHLNLIRVGTNVNGWFSDADEQEIDSAVQIMRNIYATVGIGIGRVERYSITAAQANGRQDIDSNDEAETLTDEWTVPNNALDVFFVLTYAGNTIGLSEPEGSCDKNAKSMTGSVIAIEGSPTQTARTLAHEIGHYLGLEHPDDSSSLPNNLMHQSKVTSGLNLTNEQGQEMREHCFVQPACST